MTVWKLIFRSPLIRTIKTFTSWRVSSFLILFCTTNEIVHYIHWSKKSWFSMVWWEGCKELIHISIKAYESQLSFVDQCPSNHFKWVGIQFYFWINDSSSTIFRMISISCTVFEKRLLRNDEDVPDICNYHNFLLNHFYPPKKAFRREQKKIEKGKSRPFILFEPITYKGKRVKKKRR